MDEWAWLTDALADLERRGLKRTLRERHSARPGYLTLENRTLVNFGSNDYLGLAGDERIAAAARGAIAEYGWGAGASALVSGRTTLHAQLEQKIAEFERAEAALLFPSGYAANAGTIAALVGKGDVIFSDALNHASIIDGCRLSGASVHVYPHGDAAFVGTALKTLRGAGRALIVTDGLFSMTGDFAPLAELAAIAGREGAMLLVDEAHATGVLGEQGRGVCEQAGVEGGSIVRVGTLSKALGGIGGFAVGSRKLIDWLANRARPYVFSTALPPAAAAAAIRAIEIVEQEPERRERLRALVAELGQKLVAAGLLKVLPESQIIPIVLGEAERTMAASAALAERGFFVPGIRPPSVPVGQSLLRISLSSDHTHEQIAGLVAGLVSVARYLEI